MMGSSRMLATRSARRWLVALLGTALAWLAAASPVHAFDVQGFDALFHEPVTYPIGFGQPTTPPDLGTYPAATQAGGHADLTVEFRLDTSDQTVDDLVVDLPAGFYGNPQAAPQCAIPDFLWYTCAPETQVGIVHVRSNADWTTALGVYNLPAADGETAQLGFRVAGIPVKVGISVRTDGDHGLRAIVRNINEAAVIEGARLTLWGVPADSVHDAQRYAGMQIPLAGMPSSAPRRPFLTLPTRCGEPLTATMRTRSWQQQDRWIEASSAVAPLTGCDQLAFDGSFSATPENTTADTPSAYDIELAIPQSDDPDGLATPTLRKVAVTFPEGVAISPGVAAGLVACPDDRTGIGTLGDASCPEASKIGTVRIETPVLPDPLTGEVFVREPKPGNLFRLLLVARGSGVFLKLPGDILPDPRTGQITAVFDNTPQLPFSALTMRLKGGPRAPLVNPLTCGEKTTTAELSSWGGPTARSSSSFVVHGCATAFAPVVEAGTLNPLAGAFSPLVVTVRRPAGQPEIRGLAVDLPPGLLGAVRGVPQCPDAQAASGACGEESRVGSVTVEAGSGERPYPLAGTVFLAGRYKGAPFSLVFVVRAVAGPYDLGTVVVRAPIVVDANRAKLDVPSDPIPTILEGVPVRLQTISITMDRERFTFNATNCDRMVVGVVVESVGGIRHGATVPYQAQRCGDVPLEPRLELELTNRTQTTDGKHPGLRAKLTQRPGEAGLRQVQVKLPLSLALDPDNAQALCTPQQAEQRACPETSIIGHATAVTPALNEPLSGPVYFVEGIRQTASGQTRRTLPNLWLKLSGEVELDLWARSDVVDDHLVTTFTSVPDAPISSFDLTIQGGRHGVLVVSNANLCQAAQVTQATFDGQNGKRHRSQVVMGLPCAFKVARTTRVSPAVTALTVSGIGAGRLTVSGPGIRRATRTIKGANVARIDARLTAAARRQLARTGRLTRRVTVTFTPAAGGKASRTTTTVTFRR